MVKYRRLSIRLTLLSLLAGLICAGMSAVQRRKESFGYWVSLPVGRVGDKPEASLVIAPSAGQKFRARGVEVVWNGRRFDSRPGLDRSLDSAEVIRLEDLGIDLPAFTEGASRIEVTHVSLLTPDGRTLQFPGRVSAEARAIPRDSDFLLELIAAARGLGDNPSPTHSECKEMVQLDEPWGDAQWAASISLLRRNSKAIEATLQALHLYPSRSEFYLRAPFSESLLGLRTLGCLLLLLGRAEQNSGEMDAAIQTYLDTINIGLGVALSGEAMIAMMTSHAITGQATRVLGGLVAGGSLDNDPLWQIEAKLEKILIGWRTRVPSVEHVLARERPKVSPTMWYYSPIGPISREIMEGLMASQYSSYADRFAQGLNGIRIVVVASSSCRHYRQSGRLPGRESWPEGIGIEPVSGAEWIVAAGSPKNSETSKELCWKEPSTCTGRLGLRVRCGGG